MAELTAVGEGLVWASATAVPVLLTGLVLLAGAAVCGALAVALGLRAVWGYLAPSRAPSTHPAARWAGLRPTSPAKAQDVAPETARAYALVARPGTLREYQSADSGRGEWPTIEVTVESEAPPSGRVWN